MAYTEQLEKWVVRFVVDGVWHDVGDRDCGECAPKPIRHRGCPMQGLVHYELGILTCDGCRLRVVDESVDWVR